MELLRSKPAYEVNRILEEGPRQDFWRILRYLKKQKMTWGILQDYWHMAHTAPPGSERQPCALASQFARST